MAKARLEWVDVGKGLSIIGVLVYHVVVFTGVEDSVMFRFSEYLGSVRMSLFFLLSGLFAHKIATMTWGEVFTKRLWYWIPPYLVWGSATFALLVFMHGTREWGLGNMGAYLINPGHGIWFLYALALYTVAARLMRNLPPAVVMWITIVVPITMPVWYQDPAFIRVIMFAPYFFAGLYARGFILEFMSRKKSWREWALFIAVSFAGYWLSTTAYLRIVLASVVSDNPDTQESVDAMALWWPIMVKYSGSVGFGLLLCVLLAKIPVVKNVLMWYGSHTLPLYLSNEIILWAVTWVDNVKLGGALRRATEGHDTLYVLIIFSIMLAGGHVVYLLSKVPVIGWIVTPPPIHKKSTALTEDRGAGQDPPGSDMAAPPRQVPSDAEDSSGDAPAQEVPEGRDGATPTAKVSPPSRI